jgi:uncharacterized protein
LLVPALRAAGDFELSADLQWGARRERAAFRHTYQGVAGESAAAELGEPGGDSNDDIEQLMAELAQIPSKFQAQRSTSLVDLPGVGLCLPDLTFVDSTDGARKVHFELLGYWSRASVWKRVEMVEAGLPEPILFGVNQRLRVSEEVLDKNASGALYVFRGQPNAKTLLERVERLALQGHLSSDCSQSKARRRKVGG